MKTSPKKSILLYVLLTLVCFTLNAQTFVTLYSENFETIDDGTTINTIGYGWWGNLSTVKQSVGNGANLSNGFISTNSTVTIGISRVFTLTAGKQYRCSNSVKFTTGLQHYPLRLWGSNNNNYYNVAAVTGTGNWENYSHTFTVDAGNETVTYVSIKNNEGELALDNVKMEVEGIGWTGAVSTNWHDPGNWEGNAVPLEDDHVLITNVTNLPIISDSEVRVTSLEIADGAKLLVQNNQILIVKGQLTGNTGYVELLTGSTLFANRIVGDNHIITELGFFSINSVFQSHMVLQRQQPIPIYGSASDGLTVSVTLDGETKTTTASGGKWEVIFDAKEAGGGAINLSVSGTNTYAFADILMGDVWICSGQSNMGRNVSTFQSYPEFANVPGTYENNQIRFATVKIYESNELQDNVQIQGGWVDANPTSITSFSATGYFFGKYLQPEINVPLGLIKAARGGTGMGSFIPLDDLNNNAYAQTAYDYGAIGLTGPSTLYNTMIHPLTKQKIKGVIWYQGEHETSTIDQTKFSSIFTTLINSWRDAWGRNDLPFIFTQLPGWGNVYNYPIESISAIVRQQQLDTWNALPYTGMAVSIDGGMTTDVHPPNKEDVGSRLALFARKLAYGEDITYSGPKIREAVRVINTDKAIVKFKHFGAGLESRAITLNIHGPEQYNLVADSIYGFELAGANKVFYSAKAVIENDSIITVTHKNVAQPAFVRYGWAHFPLTNLINDVGLPASPFEKEIAIVESDNSLSTSDVVLETNYFSVIPTLVKKGEHIKVESSVTDPYRVEIRDAIGRLISQTNSSANSKVLLCSKNLNSGVYIILFKSGSTTRFKRILVH